MPLFSPITRLRLAYLGASIALVAAVLGSLPNAAHAAAPIPVLLGTSDNFAVLAGSGITNTGATTIVGDVGSSPTHSETGFSACPGANCVTLTGTNHNQPDPNDTATQTAKAALTVAYNNAAGQTPTVQPTELADLTLGAGVYNSASGTFGMTGTLTLDGANDPNAIFIFQTASTLITDSTGNVALIRGAQACNVFWKIGSAATLAANSTFRGTVLAHDDISLGDGVTVDGRLLAGAQPSGAGAVTLIHDTISRPTCLTPTPSPTPTGTVGPTSTPTPSLSPTGTVGPTSTPTPSLSPTGTVGPTSTPTPSPSPAETAGPTLSPSPAVTGGPTAGPPTGDSTSDQVTQVPRGPVDTGDGTLSDRRR
jgi:hypothetical protein